MVKLATQVAIDTDASELVPFDKDRTSLVLVNISGQNAFIEADRGVTAATGHRIRGNGGTLNLNVGFGDDPTLQLFAITGAGSTTISTFTQRGKNKVVLGSGDSE